MFTRIFAFFALAFALFGTECWAQSVFCSESESPNCFTFDSADPSHTYTFGDGSTLVVTFDKVLQSFELMVVETFPTDPLPLDPSVFPPNTVCVKYFSHSALCGVYNFTGDAGGGVSGVPVKNVNYKGMITLILSYFSGPAQTPAFGHAPDDTTTFSEDILTGYSTDPTEDPTMKGTTPGLSKVVALDEKLTESDTICNLTLSPNPPYTVGQEIEVSFQLFSTPCSGTPLRDKTAHFSLSTRDSNGNVIFPPIRDKEEGNKFHWDKDEGVNELDLSTEGLPTGPSGQYYTLTVFSSKASPRSVQFFLAPAPPDPDHH
jgi:hypothetical protein